MQHEITLTGAKAEIFCKAKYAFTKYWLDNLPGLGIKRQMKNFAKEYPIKLLQDTDGTYFSEQIAEIYNDPIKFEAATIQFADTYGEQIYAGCEAYAKSVRQFKNCKRFLTNTYYSMQWRIYYMLSRYFENCYGIKQLQLTNISFNPCNKAVVYAPNGVMKTSLAKVFEDISKGAPASDRIFKNLNKNDRFF